MWKTLILRVIQTLEIVLMMFFAAFCSYLKNLPEAKIKRFVLTEFIRKSQKDEQRLCSLVKSHEEHFEQL